MATLTGAARVALGPELPALFANDDALADDLLRAGTAERDPLWRLPLWGPYRDMLKSPVADINNVSESGFAGAITAALYLQRIRAGRDAVGAYRHLCLEPEEPARPAGGRRGAGAARASRADRATLRRWPTRWRAPQARAHADAAPATSASGTDRVKHSAGKRVATGFAWDLFLFAGVFGVPLFLRGLPNWGATVLALWRRSLIGVRPRARPRSQSELALFAGFLGLQLWLGFIGNRLTARTLLAHGWTIDAAERQRHQARHREVEAGQTEPARLRPPAARRLELERRGHQRACRGRRGAVKICAAGPLSTTLPSFITRISCASAAPRADRG